MAAAMEPLAVVTSVCVMTTITALTVSIWVLIPVCGILSNSALAMEPALIPVLLAITVLAMKDIMNIFLIVNILGPTSMRVTI